MCRSENMEKDVPSMLRPTLSLVRALPKIYFPGTKFNVGFTIFSAIFLIAFRYAAVAFLESYGWAANNTMTAMAAASVGSILHSFILVPQLGVLLMTQPFVPSARMNSAPQWWQESADSMLQLCTGYMIYDCLISFVVDKWVPGVGLVYADGDSMFVFHHIATSIYMTSARIIGAGHQSAMICMFLGEFSNPFQNMFYFLQFALKMDCCNGSFTQTAYMYTEFSFALVYAVIRIFIGPVFFAYTSKDLFSKQGRQNIPLVLNIPWNIMIWGVVFGSLPWIQDCVEMVSDGLETKYGMNSEL